MLIQKTGQRARALCLSMLLAGLVLVACAPGAPAASTAEAPAATADSTLPATPGRGTDGALNILFWQAVSILNPYLSAGAKDYQAASLVLEPLYRFDTDGVPIPTLIEEIPTLANGGISEDLTTITYTLQEDILWSDGTPLTAEDVVFTWQFCIDPLTGCTSFNFIGVANVEALDTRTVRVHFDGPRPYPFGPFGGPVSPILQRAQFAECIGEAAQSCAQQNSFPIGTGPYQVQEFSTNDVVIYTVNPNYRVPDAPHFAEVVLKGGGDAVAAARAVLVTSEVDFSWNLQVEPALLEPMLAEGQGQLVVAYGALVERLLLNFTNPDPALDNARSEWLPDDANAHPFLSDINVRRAMSMAIDRQLIAEQLYGASAQPTCNILAGPPLVVSTANDDCLIQDIEGAKAVLEEAGWVDSNGDGVREKDGVELRVLYQAPTNSVRQATQALIQQWWQEIGIATELRSIVSNVFFSSDPASPDTMAKFFADVEMFANGPDTTDPETYLAAWICNEGESIVGAANHYSGTNYERWCSPEYDALFAELSMAADPAERARLAIALNDMLAQNFVNLPLVYRGDVSAHGNTLTGVIMNPWDSQFWNIGDWQRVR